MSTSFITKTVTIPTSVYADSVKLMGEHVNFSAYACNAVRHHNKRLKLRNVVEFVSELDESEKELLQKELQKKGS